MVKVERSFPAPESLAEEAKKLTGRYDKSDVISMMRESLTVVNRILKSICISTL